jgi:hypothetical protein
VFRFFLDFRPRQGRIYRHERTQKGNLFYSVCEVFDKKKLNTFFIMLTLVCYQYRTQIVTDFSVCEFFNNKYLLYNIFS